MRLFWILIAIVVGGSGVALADQGMTSPSHTANAGKIVFSKKPIEFRKEVPSQFAEQFQLTDPLYGRLYFQRALANTPLLLAGQRIANDDSGSYEILLTIDGQNQAYRFGVFAKGKVSETAAREWTSWQFNLNPADPKGADEAITVPWVKLASQLSPGSHQVHLAYWGTLGQARTPEPMAEGSFTLEVKAGQSLATGNLPADQYSGADLESLRKSMRSALLGPVAKSASEILEVAVTSDWQTGHYTDTLVEYRKIQGTVLWADNNNDGFCRYTSYSFIQDRQGSGWSSLRFNAFVNGGPEGDVKK